MSIDEKIAKLERAKKVLEEEAKNASAKNEEVNEKEDELTQEEINNAINSGFLEIENRKFEFIRKACLGNNLEIPIMEKYFELVSDTNENLVLKKEEEGLAILINIVPGNDHTVVNFKRGMEQNFKDMGLYIEWLEEKEIKKEKSKIKYFTFLTPTGLGTVYNLIFFCNIKNKIIIGNLNCPYKDEKVWGKVFKGMVELIAI